MRQQKEVKKKSSNEFQNKHEKAKKIFFNIKQPKGNKGNNKWSDFDDDTLF